MNNDILYKIIGILLGVDVKELLQESKKAKSELSSLERENKSLKERLISVTESLTSNEAEIKQLHLTIANKRNEILLTNETNEYLKKEYADLQDTNVKLASKIALLNKTKADLNLDKQKRDEQIDSLNASLLQSNSIIESLKREKSSADIQLKETESELSKQINALNEELVSLHNENERLGMQITEIQGKLDAATDEVKKIKEEKVPLLSENISVQEKEEKKETPITNINQESIQLDSEIQEKGKKTEGLIKPSDFINNSVEEESSEGTDNVTILAETIDEPTSTVTKSIHTSLEQQQEEDVDNKQSEAINTESGEQNKDITDTEGSLVEEVQLQSNIEKVLDNEDDVVEDDADMDEDDFEDTSLPIIYDYGLIPAEKLSIPRVYDVKEGKLIEAKDFFSQNESELMLWRRNLQEEYLMGEARFICPECKQPVKISGHKLQRGRVCYFTHFKGSDDCVYKTGTNRTKEEIERQKYSLIQESLRHKRLKALIEKDLRGEKSQSLGISNVECEKHISSQIPYLNFRRPDVYAEYNGRKLVFELQLSTTFVSVIVERDIFYRLNGFDIIWVFNFEDNNEYVNLHNLMCKDIYYANKRNVFIFDKEAQERSEEEKQLILKCRWLDENGVWSPDRFVYINDFLFDEENHKPYIFDADKAYLEKHPEILENRKQLEHSREDILAKLIERQRREADLAAQKELERMTLQKQLQEEDKTVELFRSGTKYGYKYQGKTILPAKYTSAEEIQENGYAKVGFNRKIGLVRREGKELVPVEYKYIDVLDKNGIVLAYYKRIDLYIGDERFALTQEFEGKEQRIIKEEYGGKDVYVLRTNTYYYSYSRSYYGDHPMCRKSFNGYDKDTLFAILRQDRSVVIWIRGNVKILKKNTLYSLNETYSDLKATGREDHWIVKDASTKLWGIIDTSENQIVPFKYDDLIPTKSQLVITKKKADYYGIVDYFGQEKCSPKFALLIYLNKGLFAFKENQLWGICNEKGEVLHKPEYTYVKVDSSEKIKAATIASYSNKWTVFVDDCTPSYNQEVKLCELDTNGDIDYTETVHGEYIVRQSSELYSVLSRDCAEIFGYELDSIKVVDEKIVIFTDVLGRCGIINDGSGKIFEGCKEITRLIEGVYSFRSSTGHVAIGNVYGPTSEFSFECIIPIDNSHFVATIKNGYGYYAAYRYSVIDNTGKQISQTYNSIGDFKDGRAEVQQGDRKGFINEQGELLELAIEEYGTFSLYNKLGNLYFKNGKGDKVSEEYEKIECLIGTYFKVKKWNENHFVLYDLSEQKVSENKYVNITYVKENMFVVDTQVTIRSTYGYGDTQMTAKNVLREFNPVFENNFRDIKLLDNGYFVLQEYNEYGQGASWRIANLDGELVTDRKFDKFLKALPNGFEVMVDGKVGVVDLAGNEVIEKSVFDATHTLLKSFESFGLEDNEGDAVLSLEEHLSSIEKIDESFLKVKKENLYALFTIKGEQLTEFVYESIDYDEGSCFQVVRGGIKGQVDKEGNEIAHLEPFNGGFVRSAFGEYAVIDESKNVLISGLYNNIEILDNNGVFALWQQDKVKLANSSKTIMEESFDSAKSAGHSFFIVSKVVDKAIREKKTGYGYRGNPYTYYKTRIVSERRFGIVDSALRLVMPCKYTSISEFNSEDNITITNRKNKVKAISLKTIQQKSHCVKELSIGTEYTAKVATFHHIGLIIKIGNSSMMIHKKYLYKNQREFSKGETFAVKFLGKDRLGYPMWETEKIKTT